MATILAFLSQPNSSYLSVTILSEAVIVEILTAQALRLRTNPRREHEANICHPRMGPTLTQKEVGGCDLVVLHLAVESPWSASGGPFCSFFTQTGLEDCPLAL